MAGNEFLNFFLLSAVEAPANLVGWLGSEHLGRRWTEVGFLAITGISCLTIMPLLFCESVHCAAVLCSHVPLLFCDAVFIPLLFCDAVFILPLFCESLLSCGPSALSRRCSPMSSYRCFSVSLFIALRSYVFTLLLAYYVIFMPLFCESSSF